MSDLEARVAALAAEVERLNRIVGYLAEIQRNHSVAIVRIEEVLGVNPHGDMGTVAARIDALEDVVR